MFWTGCLALMIAGGMVCYSGNPPDELKITCSDAQIPGLETCTARAARVGLAIGSTNQIIVTIPAQGPQ